MILAWSKASCSATLSLMGRGGRENQAENQYQHQNELLLSLRKCKLKKLKMFDICLDYMQNPIYIQTSLNVENARQRFFKDILVSHLNVQFQKISNRYSPPWKDLHPLPPVFSSLASDFAAKILSFKTPPPPRNFQWPSMEFI